MFNRVPRIVTTAVLSAALVLPAMVPSASEAQSGTRTLKVYYIHTKEKAEITFKRNGRYDQKGLQQLNHFLRDWRRNEPTKMDPRLFDLVWEVYQKSGSRGYINVVSAYRSPATNSMLRSRSTGVAQKSQHTMGRAMDFYIPDVKLSRLREIAMQFQVGGVGYYPKSGSPFVHLDVGSVRAWPRMSRQELVRLFPDGKTMHLPADGKPLPGFDAAVADYKRRVGADSVQVAGGGSKDTTPAKRRNLLATLFGAGGDEDEEPTAIASAQQTRTPARATAAAVAQRPAAQSEPVAETEVAFTAPVPLVRPAFREENAAPATELALVAPTTSGAAAALDAALPAAQEQQQAREFADLDGLNVPVPLLRGPREQPQPGDAVAELLTASAGPIEDMQEFSAVPVPGSRPAFESALMAAAEVEVVVPEADDNAGLSVVADAAQSEGLSVEASARVALALPTVRDDDQPVEMLALVSPKAAQKRSLASLNAFDGVAGEAASKGGRPQKKDADAAARGAIRTEPKLTQNAISQWALTQGRVATLSKPVKAPRFVSHTMRAAPTTVYLAGFRQEDTYVDPGRFSGTAVNFMEVRKFAQAN